VAKGTRDSQWGKVRDAIAEVDQGFQIPQAQVQEFVDTVLRSRWYRNRYRIAHPAMARKATGLLMPPKLSVTYRSDRWQDCEARYYADDHKAIWTPCNSGQSPSQPSILGALHALSHLIVTEQPAHCPEWAMTYLKMVQQFAPTASFNAMRASFREHRVKTFTWSDDAKAAAKVRAAERQFKDAGDRARRLVAALEADD
jgi:hypothetical protein